MNYPRLTLSGKVDLSMVQKLPGCIFENGSGDCIYFEELNLPKEGIWKAGILAEVQYREDLGDYGYYAMSSTKYGNRVCEAYRIEGYENAVSAMIELVEKYREMNKDYVISWKY